MHAASIVKGENGFVIYKVLIMENAHPLIHEPALFFEPCQCAHCDNGYHGMSAAFLIKGFKFAPGFALVRGEGAVKAPRPLISGPVGIGGDQDQLIRLLRVRKLQR